MNTQTNNKSVLSKGGEFLVKESDPITVFTPEEFSEESVMVRESVKDFVTNSVIPQIETIEKNIIEVNKNLCDEIGALGIYSTHMPEDLGGMNLDFNTNTVIGEEIGRGGGSFSVTYNAHTGIGMLPILYFGTEEQKEKYLPKLMTAEMMAAYCLTEPSSGSDALSAKTKAVLSEDGKHYILNGQKMWISNAGFADIFTVFAQVDGDKFTGFIVEKDTPGLSLGEEERKLGIKGSSTRLVFLEDAKVPVENVLGKIGEGHKIAFNALNTGRFKLGAGVLGGSKSVFDMAVAYANERKQFGTEIANFGAIKYKLAQMAIRIYITDSIVYRTSDLINEKTISLKEAGKTVAEAKLEAAKEFALESSIIKVEGSEGLDYCVDEAVQIFGGMGYSEEGQVARAYRDARINRIFEGTNEINRLVILSTLTKAAMKGEIDLVTPALAVQAELTQGVKDDWTYKGAYTDEGRAVKNYKKLVLMLLGSAMQLVMNKKLDLKAEQEIVMNLSDIIIDVFNTESALLRLEKYKATGINKKDLEIYEAIVKTYFHDTNARIYKHTLDAIASFIKPEKQGDYVAGARVFTKYPLQNVKELRRKIANVLIADNLYSL